VPNQSQMDGWAPPLLPLPVPWELPPLESVPCEPLPWEPPAVEPEPVPLLVESSESPPVQPEASTTVRRRREAGERRLDTVA
jgi:hypothetical protein